MAFYKARVTYKNPDWKDGEDNGDLEYHLIKEIVLNPPAEMAGVVQQELAIAQRSVMAFWGGQYPLMPRNNFYVHPARIVSIEIVDNTGKIIIAELDPQSVSKPRNVAAKE